MSRTAAQRLERGLKTTSMRGLRLNLRLKKLFSRRGQTIFISALPKSGSTFLVKALAAVTGFQPFFLGYHQLNEQDLYLPNLIDAWSMNVISHQHTRPSAPNLALMADFAIRPIILTRNAHDAAISLTDHLETASPETPLLNVPADFMDRPRTERLDMVIDLAMPWYIRFAADWAVAGAGVGAGAGWDCLWLRYEDLIADGADVVGRVLNFHGLHADPATIEAALAQARDGDSRFNKGVAGRGNELTLAQKNRIMDLTRHYPGIDFSALGLA
ncbi:MAG: sulfotransferase domain-containing protein [Alphaproteobacteria bacterium]